MLAANRNGTTESSDHILFEEVFRRYGRNWKPETLRVNRGCFARQILPWFRGQPIAEITAADARAWFASLHATPVAVDRSVPVLCVIMALRGLRWQQGWHGPFATEARLHPTVTALPSAPDEP